MTVKIKRAIDTYENSNEFISELRNNKYREITDPIKFKMDEDYVVGSIEWENSRQEWINSKNLIREQLPYVNESITSGLKNLWLV